MTLAEDTIPFQLVVQPFVCHVTGCTWMVLCSTMKSVHYGAIGAGQFSWCEPSYIQLKPNSFKPCCPFPPFPYPFPCLRHLSWETPIQIKESRALAKTLSDALLLNTVDTRTGQHICIIESSPRPTVQCSGNTDTTTFEKKRRWNT